MTLCREAKSRFFSGRVTFSDAYYFLKDFGIPERGTVLQAILTLEPKCF